MQNDSNNSIVQSIEELRQQWAQLWGKVPHRYIRRNMLEKGVQFKQAESSGEWLNTNQQKRLNQLIKQYKRDPASFDQKDNGFGSYEQLVRIWHGKKYIVTAKDDGFDYDGKTYKSLSRIAFVITGTKWNGWLFFGLKKRGKKKDESTN
jgi:Txe/YoeB family toxin of Txe-Axe toxin-antitoxin module